MQYMPHTKQHISTIYCSDGYWENGKKQDDYADMSLPAILPTTRKVV